MSKETGYAAEAISPEAERSLDLLRDEAPVMNPSEAT